MTANFAELGVFAATHLGIETSRLWRRGQGFSPDHIVQRVSLYTEHVISYSTRPFMWRFVFSVINSPANTEVYAFLWSQVQSLLSDGLLPVLEKKRPQFDQIAANLTGGLLYLLYEYAKASN